MRLFSHQIQYDEGISYHSLSSIESKELGSQIISKVKHISNNTMNENSLVIENEEDFDKLNSKNWISITVNEGLFQTMENELLLNDYPHVQVIHIKKRSFENIKSLTISNLPELQFLIFDDNSFYNTTSLTLSSILDESYNELIFLIFLLLLLMINHSKKLLVLLYQVYSSSLSLFNRCSF